jgi:excisionase family DNA binding protein
VNDQSIESILSERPLTIDQAAEYLQIPRRSLRELCDKRKIAHARLDFRNWRFKKADLDAYLEKRTVLPR